VVEVGEQERCRSGKETGVETVALGRPRDRPRRVAIGIALFAVVITVLVLELQTACAPHPFRALLLLWPRGLSYAVTCLFMASSNPTIIF
jgi:hypothetical protein